MGIHTHVYLPLYASFSCARGRCPQDIHETKSWEPGVEDRLVIPDNEPYGGRPVGPQVFLVQ